MTQDEAQTAIGVLQGLIRSKEDDIASLKRSVNETCSKVGMEPIYQNIASESAGDISALRSDQFYGQTIYSAARKYLEMRGASGLGAASVNDIYAALRRGGFKFEAKDDENAKNGLRVSLRKQSTIFHRLPGGDYGLLAWYPKAKPPKDEDDEDEKPAKAPSPQKPRKAQKQAKAAKKPVIRSVPTPDAKQEAA